MEGMPLLEDEDIAVSSINSLSTRYYTEDAVLHDLATLESIAPKFYDVRRQLIVKACAKLKDGGHATDLLGVHAMFDHMTEATPDPA